MAIRLTIDKWIALLTFLSLEPLAYAGIVAAPLGYRLARNIGRRTSRVPA